jgi:hypothetical protein
MHYGFSNETRVRNFLEIISASLRTGGVFIGTTVDDRKLLTHKNEKGNEFGNSLYHVSFPTLQKEGGDEAIYGHSYRISVEHSVEDAEEFVVHWEPFVALAREYHLTLVETRNFSDVYALQARTDIGQRLLSVICKDQPPSREFQDDDVAGGGLGFRRTAEDRLELVLDDEEKETAFLFRTFMFRKI